MPGFALPEPTWGDPEPSAIPTELDGLGDHPILARLLAARGFADRASAMAFVDPAHRRRFDPSVFPGAAEAVDRLSRAIDRRERVLVWGDFDADGQTATALLVLALRRLGLDPDWYVPDRVEESHGLSASVLDRVAASGATLLVTCDCATTDVERIAALAGRGVDTIVTDHHPWAGFGDGLVHPARALVTPRRLELDHPACHLSGVGAAFVLAAALLASHGRSADDLLDLVALGTIADVAPMIGENRHLAQLGLPLLNGGARLGVRALLEAAGRRLVASCDGDVAGWVLAPRLNAFGRLARADRGVRLLLTDDPAEAVQLAGEAHGLNLERQRLCDQVVEMARRWIDSELLGDLPELDEDGHPPPLPSGPNLATDTALFLADPSWHPGIVGLAASRLAERYRRPVALAATGIGPTARLSMRAGTAWADLSRVVRALAADPELGFRGGGHQGAAGGDAPIEQLRDVAALFARATAAQAPPEPLKYRLTVDAELSLTELTPEACRAISLLQPFGPGNRAPTLLVRRLRLIGQARALGSSGRHFRLSVADAAGVYAGAVWWDGNPQRLPRGEFDALAAIEQNEFNGSSEVRLVVQAVRPTAAPAPVRLQQGVLL